MRNPLVLLCSLAIFTSARAELVSYWPLDETEGEVAVDTISGNNGEWQNPDINLEWVDGRIGGAASLIDAGGDNFFLIEEISQLVDAEGLTISLWINPEAQGGYNGIFMTRTINDLDNNSWGGRSSGHA